MRMESNLAESLTRREWEVLTLLREGLTNDQIAARLGISRDGAKYHVSEILSKLQVSNRLEAARWFDRVKARRHQPAFLGFFRALFRRSAAPASRILGLAAAGITLTALITLLAGVLLITRGDDNSTTNEALQNVIDTLLHANADDLATTFGEIETGEEDEWVLDAQGIQRPVQRTLDPAAWRERLAGSSARSLYAVVSNEPVIADGLWIPGGANGEVYVVQGGDTPASIAAGLGVPAGLLSPWIDELSRLNGLTNPVHFVVGHELTLPRIEPAPANPSAAPANATIILAVDTGAAALEAWAFDYVDGALVRIQIRTGSPPSTWPVAQNRLINLLRLTPSLETHYERFLVLPPVEARPAPPAQYDLSVRTGQRQVDGLIEVLQRGDPGALLTAIETPDALPLQGCEGIMTTLDTAAVRDWAAGLSISGLHYVAEVPAGHRVAASHLLMIYDQEGPYRWELLGLLERNGRIVGVVEDDCGDRWLAQMPKTYIVAPQASIPDPSRRSGVPKIDSLLDAVRDGDAQGVLRLVDWQPVACVRPGQIGSLPCEPNMTLGTVLEVVPLTACEGGYADAAELIDYLNGWALYAVPDPMTAVIIAPDRLAASASFRRSARLVFGEGGLELIQEGCFVRTPDEHLLTTHYLLAPASP